MKMLSQLREFVLSQLQEQRDTDGVLRPVYQLEALQEQGLANSDNLDLRVYDAAGALLASSDNPAKDSTTLTAAPHAYVTRLKPSEVNGLTKVRERERGRERARKTRQAL